LSAFVGDFAGGLEKQKAGVGILEIQAAAARFTREPHMVLSGIRAKERQSEAVLPFDRAVTGAGIASQPAKTAGMASAAHAGATEMPHSDNPKSKPGRMGRSESNGGGLSGFRRLRLSVRVGASER
jgi:hypothetical protein